MNAYISVCLLHRCVLLASELCPTCSHAAFKGYVARALSSQLHAVTTSQLNWGAWGLSSLLVHLTHSCIIWLMSCLQFATGWYWQGTNTARATGWLCATGSIPLSTTYGSAQVACWPRLAAASCWRGSTNAFRQQIKLTLKIIWSNVIYLWCTIRGKNR